MVQMTSLKGGKRRDQAGRWAPARPGRGLRKRPKMENLRKKSAFGGRFHISHASKPPALGLGKPMEGKWPRPGLSGGDGLPRRRRGGISGRSPGRGPETWTWRFSGGKLSRVKGNRPRPGLSEARASLVRRDLRDRAGARPDGAPGKSGRRRRFFGKRQRLVAVPMKRLPRGPGPDLNCRLASLVLRHRRDRAEVRPELGLGPAS